MKKAVVLLANGFEEIEALTVVDVLRRGGVQCDTSSINEINVIGAHNILVRADKLLSETNIDEYDSVVIPGGMPGSTNLRDDDRVINLVKKYNDEEKLISAICAGPIVLGKAGLLNDKKATSYPGFEDELYAKEYLEEIVVKDKNIITSRGPATALEFAFKILESLVDMETVLQLRSGMMADFLKEKIQEKN